MGFGFYQTAAVSLQHEETKSAVRIGVVAIEANLDARFIIFIFCILFLP